MREITLHMLEKYFITTTKKPDCVYKLDIIRNFITNKIDGVIRLIFTRVNRVAPWDRTRNFRLPTGNLHKLSSSLITFKYN